MQLLRRESERRRQTECKIGACDKISRTCITYCTFMVTFIDCTHSHTLDVVTIYGLYDKPKILDILIFLR